MHALFRRSGAVALVTATLVAACSASDGRPDASKSTDAGSRTTSARAAGTGVPSAALARFYNQQLDWDRCGGGFECARLTVPIDYARPSTGTIRLALVRLRAPGGGERSLILNPGGPGASGVTYARAAESVVSQAVRERFDIVGFDPRGVARSAPIDCVTDKQLDHLLAVDGSPDDEAEERQIADDWMVLGEGCLRDRANLARHMSTRDVARDLDVLRAVLGDRRLTYLGKSYGTYIGATYAELFPRRVGRLVLDGMIDPALPDEQIARGQAIGFDRAFRAYLAWCLKRSCPFSGGVDNAARQAKALLERIDRDPLPGETGRPVTEALAVIGVAAALYDEGSWSLLSQALREAKRGGGYTLLALADFYSDRGPRGRYTTNSIEALYAVSCLDRPVAGDLADFRAKAADFAAAAPVFGEFLAWGSLPCARWPVPPANTPHKVVAAGAAPILVVGTTRDPATPYEWSVSAAKAFENGRLLTYVGDGHTAYRRGSACIDRAVDRYFLSGTLPARGTRCR